jgi:tetratricopeptide (TPR) repeat protein
MVTWHMVANNRAIARKIKSYFAVDFDDKLARIGMKEEIMKKLLLLGLIMLFVACPSPQKNSAMIAIRDGNYARAKEQILVGLQETPDDFELYMLLMKAEIGLSQWIAATEAYQRGEAIDSLKSVNWLLDDTRNVSVFWQAFYNAAFAQMGDKEYEDALRNLGYCKILDPTRVDVYILEGGIYSELDNTEMARKAYSAALSIDPDNPEAYLLVGKAFFEKGDYDSALVKFSAAVENYQPKYDQINRVLFQNVPEVDNALKHQIIRLWKSNKTQELDEIVMVRLGFDGGMNAHKRNVETFYKTTDGIARSHYWLSLTHRNQKNNERALAHLMKSLEYMPDDLDALFFTGELLIMEEKYEDAISYFERVTALRADDVYAWFYTGVCHQQIKNYQEAIDIYEGNVLTLDPDNIDAMTNLAFIYRELGNNKKSLEYLMKVEELQKE